PSTTKKYANPCVKVTPGATDHNTDIRSRLAAARGRSRLKRAMLTLRVPRQNRKRLVSLLSKFRACVILSPGFPCHSPYNDLSIIAKALMDCKRKNTEAT